MGCDICTAPIKGRAWYCRLCRRLVQHQPEGKARVAGLKRSRRDDGFHCEYFDVLLNTDDPSHPMYLHFDHRTPGVLNDLAVTGAVINVNKANLTYLEHPVVIRESVNCWDTGTPFRKDIVPFSAWNATSVVKATNARLVAQAVGPRHLDAGLLQTARRVNACGICDRYAAVERGLYCPRCKQLLNCTLEPWSVLVPALRKAYNYELDAFMCYHLGVPLELYDWTSPFYLWFDHLVPRKKGHVVVSSVLANRMKSDLDEEEYHAFTRMMLRAIDGGTFDVSALTFKYWKRNWT